jgi:hypothetical protein
VRGSVAGVRRRSPVQTSDPGGIHRVHIPGRRPGLQGQEAGQPGFLDFTTAAAGRGLPRETELKPAVLA